MSWIPNIPTKYEKYKAHLAMLIVATLGLLVFIGCYWLVGLRLKAINKGQSDVNGGAIATELSTLTKDVNDARSLDAQISKGCSESIREEQPGRLSSYLTKKQKVLISSLTLVNGYCQQLSNKDGELLSSINLLDSNKSAGKHVPSRPAQRYTAASGLAHSTTILSLELVGSFLLGIIIGLTQTAGVKRILRFLRERKTKPTSDEVSSALEQQDPQKITADAMGAMLLETLRPLQNEVSKLSGDLDSQLADFKRLQEKQESLLREIASRLDRDSSRKTGDHNSEADIRTDQLPQIFEPVNTFNGYQPKQYDNARNRKTSGQSIQAAGHRPFNSDSIDDTITAFESKLLRLKKTEDFKALDSSGYCDELLRFAKELRANRGTERSSVVDIVRRSQALPWPPWNYAGVEEKVRPAFEDLAATGAALRSLMLEDIRARFHVEPIPILVGETVYDQKFHDTKAMFENTNDRSLANRIASVVEHGYTDVTTGKVLRRAIVSAYHFHEDQSLNASDKPPTADKIVDGAATGQSTGSNSPENKSFSDTFSNESKDERLSTAIQELEDLEEKTENFTDLLDKQKQRLAELLTIVIEEDDADQSFEAHWKERIGRGKSVVIDRPRCGEEYHARMIPQPPPQLKFVEECLRVGISVGDTHWVRPIVKPTDTQKKL